MERISRQIDAIDARDLTAQKKQRFARIVAGASSSARRGRLCDALRRIDALRTPLSRPGTYRRKKVPAAARLVDKRIERVERLLLRTRQAKRCARRTERARLAPTTASPPFPELPAILPLQKKEQPDEEGFLRPGRGKPLATGKPVEIQVHGQTASSEKPTVSFAQPGNPTTVFRLTDLGVPQRTGQDFSGGLWEPQVASAPGGVVFYSGNYDAAYSLDGGASFTFVDPRTMFRQVDGGFCCDTALRYAPQINRFIWLIQYWCAPPASPGTCNAAGAENRYLLLVASPDDIRNNTANPGAAWRQYNITPTLLNERGGWFDFPHLEIGRQKVHFSWNVLNNGPQHALVMRADLRELARGGAIGLQWFRDTDSFVRVAQNSGSRTFMVRNIDYSSSRFWTWDEASNVVLWRAAGHAQIPVRGYQSSAVGGFDWVANRSPGARILGFTKRADELWVLWGAGRCYGDPAADSCSAGEVRWPQPHLQLAVFDAGSLRVIREEAIWNRQLAFAYGSLATNSQNEVGMVFSLGGPSTNPAVSGNPTFGVAMLTGRRDVISAVQASAGTSQSPTIQGDYNGIDVDGGAIDPRGGVRTQFAVAGYAQVADASSVGQRYHPFFLRFGRR